MTGALPHRPAKAPKKPSRGLSGPERMRRAFFAAAALLGLLWAFQGQLLKAQDAPAEGAGGPWTIAYVEAGPYPHYRQNLLGLAMGLEDLGIIERGVPPAASSKSSLAIWRWLSGNAGGDRLLFPPGDFYSASWDEATLRAMAEAVLAKAAKGEIDLILAFGTMAGSLLATSDHGTPVLSITATDPVAAGLSKTPERSGLGHVHVQVEAGKIERQLSIFHNVFGFKVLGVPYDPSPEGRSVVGLASIERMAGELGFALARCEAPLEIPDSEAASASLVSCMERLSLESDAIYLTVSNGAVESKMEEILAPAIKRRLPTFSQKGPPETRLGVLMSLDEDDFTGSGQFEARVVQKVLSGILPGDIDQIYYPPMTMALNIKTAMAIGWDPPFEVLAAVDELYTAVSPPAASGAADGGD